MYTAGKKTRQINTFKRTGIISPRDIYARYGERRNIRAIHSTDAATLSDVMPSGSAVIDSMIAGQKMIRKNTAEDE